jgi:hypothetical protein
MECKLMTQEEIERIILVEVLDFKKPERAGSHCRRLAQNAAKQIIEGFQQQERESVASVETSS